MFYSFNQNSTDITQCCIVGYKYSIVGYISIYSNKDFSPLKNDLLLSTGITQQRVEIFMRFSAKRFALAALSAYYNYTKIVKNFVI